MTLTKKHLIISIFALSLLALGSLYALPTHDSQNKALPSLAPMLAKITPAIVNISTKGHYQGRNQLPDLFQDPLFQQFFRFKTPQHKQQSHALGSGVIVDAEKGYILTNNHVIDNASEILVTLKDGRSLQAELIGTDPQIDIAVLKVHAKDLSPIKLANSDILRVGDFALAIGHPFGLGQTVTSGIISGLGRSGLGIEGYEDFIQTDASINPGNSGGALVNLHGELIGINTAIFSKSGGNIGIGFAIPVNMAKSVMNQLIQYGSMQRGLLGVQIQDLTPDLASALDADISNGAVVAQVISNSPASKANIKTGDIIISVNGRSINDSSDLRNQIGLKRPGENVQLKLLRGKKTLNLKVTIGGKNILPNHTTTTHPTQGFAAKQLHSALDGAYFSTQTSGQGVSVIKVERGSPAWQSGLRKNDTIIAINRHSIHSLNDLKQLSKNNDTQAIALNIQRGNSALFLILR
jgi:serine protease Do/serine protease DegQ